MCGFSGHAKACRPSDLGFDRGVLFEGSHGRARLGVRRRSVVLGRIVAMRPPFQVRARFSGSSSGSSVYASSKLADRRPTCSKLGGQGWTAVGRSRPQAGRFQANLVKSGPASVEPGPASVEAGPSSEQTSGPNSASFSPNSAELGSKSSNSSASKPVLADVHPSSTADGRSSAKHGPASARVDGASRSGGGFRRARRRPVRCFGATFCGEASQLFALKVLARYGCEAAARSVCRDGAGGADVAALQGSSAMRSCGAPAARPLRRCVADTDAIGSLSVRLGDERFGVLGCRGSAPGKDGPESARF